MHPFFTAVTLLTTALAIVSPAALTGVLRATLWSALPYPEANQLVGVADSNRLKPASGGLTGIVRIGALQELKHNGHAVFYPWAIITSTTTPLVPVDRNRCPCRVQRSA